MKSVGTILRTMSYGIAIVLVVIFLAIPAVIFIALPESWRLKCAFCFHVETFVYWLLIKSWFVPLTIVNQEGIPDKPVIFAANHSSSIDVPLLGYVTRGRPHLWLAWYKLTRYPILGYFIKKLAVLVDTSSPRRAVEALSESAQRIRESHRDLLIFPEGQRFDDGKVHDFFRGFAILARETNRSVVPVYLENAAKVCAPRTIWINYAPLRIVVGPEFSYQEGESDKEFLDRVHSWFVQQTAQ